MTERLRSATGMIAAGCSGPDGPPEVTVTSNLDAAQTIRWHQLTVVKTAIGVRFAVEPRYSREDPDDADLESAASLAEQLEEDR